MRISITSCCLLLMSSLLLISCTTTKKSSEQQVHIADGVIFTLIPTIPFDDGLRLTQSASITYDNESHDLIFQTEIIDDRLTMVGLTPTGTRLFTIIMHHGIIQADGLSALVEKIQPQYLLADLQLSLWPEGAIKAALSAPEQLVSNDSQRQLLIDNKAVITIQYAAQPYYQGNIEYRHHQRNYHIAISPLSVEDQLVEDKRVKNQPVDEHLLNQSIKDIPNNEQ